MRRYQLALCVLALLSPVATSAQDDTWEDEEDEYEAYFGRSEGSYEPGPSSLAEAKKQGRGYRIGSGGIHDKDEVEEVGELHVVQEGDTLWGITERYFEDPMRWPEVWAWNPEITNPHWIYPLDTVRLSRRTLELEQAAALAASGQADVDKLPTARAKVQRIGAPGAQAKPVGRRHYLEPGTVFLRDQGYLDDDAIKSAGQILSAAEEQMFLSLGDQVYVTVGEGEAPKPGDRYTVYRRMPAADRIPGAKGELVRIYGTVQVRSFDANKKVARGLIVEAVNPIERGFRVARMEREYDLVGPRKNSANVIAKILTAVKPVDLYAYGDVVFLDVGVDAGVAPGNRFFVVRRGDAWVDTLERPPDQMGNSESFERVEPEKLPKEVVAELRVVKVGKETTVALVVRSDTDLVSGDIAEMRVGY